MSAAETTTTSIGGEISIPIAPTIDGYRKFIECKKLPRYRVVGRDVLTDSVSYAKVFGGDLRTVDIYPSPHILDFQRDVVSHALESRRYAAFLDCGLGKTPIALAWAMSVAVRGKVLILCPLAVLNQIIRECNRWYGFEPVNLRHAKTWSDGIAIMNYESRRHIDMAGVAGVVLDEASILKNDSGETRNWLCGLVSNVEYRLTDSATPAPNDQEEYASQAVFNGLVRTSKEFYARFFRKDGPRWILKEWARKPFYKYMSTWATYIKSPSSLGYDPMTEMREEPDYIFERVASPKSSATPELGLVPDASNGKFRSKAFGEMRCDPDSPRTRAILDFADGHKTIVWCARDAEEKMLKSALSDSMVVNGKMPIEQRVEAMDAWKAGEFAHLISKPSVLGFGVNLPEASRMIFSGFTYSFEQFYQAVRRAHRYGRSGRLQVLVPYTFEEYPIVNALKRKMDTFDRDVLELQSYMAIRKEGEQ